MTSTMSTRFSRSCLNESGINARPFSRGKWGLSLFSAGEARLDERRDLAHVGLAGKLALERAHDLAHVLGAARAGGGNHCIDFLLEVAVAYLRRQVGRQHLHLGLFD